MGRLLNTFLLAVGAFAVVYYIIPPLVLYYFDTHITFMTKFLTWIFSMISFRAIVSQAKGKS